MSYLLTQLDGEDVEINKAVFENIPTYVEFSDIAYYVDRLDTKSVYKDIMDNIGDWVYARSYNEDGDSCEYYVDDGVYFLLEEKLND